MVRKGISSDGFNPRTYIRYDREIGNWAVQSKCFNPRTYIRYDADNQYDQIPD